MKVLTGMRLNLAIVLGLALLGASGTASAQSLSAPFKPVTFQAGDTLRGLAETHLRDPDLWPQVLAANGIAAVTDLRPGTVLLLPVEQVLAVDGALDDALQAIQRATAEGAQLFAPDQIETAIERRDTAAASRLDGAWAEAVDFASVATRFATEALDISRAQRDRAAEALLTDVHGAVEGRAPAEASWTDRDIDAVLVEFERVRTLSASTAQITFRDLSRLRLNPNSNATIQTMRSDPLTGGEVTKVNLVSGDFYALLNQISDRTEFEIVAGGLTTTTESNDFWVQSDDTGARFANYDQAALQIGEGADAFSLGQNEGAVVGTDGRAQVTGVLARGELVAPVAGETVFGRVVSLQWAEIPAAAGYWLEVASDPAFNEMRLSEWGIRETGFEAASLDQGRYHWRIAALDGFGLPGAWSKAGQFELVSDSTPPYLAVLSPTEGSLVDTPSLRVVGETEAEVQLAVNGAPVMVDALGRFAADVTLPEGPGEILLEAVDAAGNRTERRVAILYRPRVAAAITLDAGLPRRDDGVLLTRTDSLALRARTDAAPGLALRVSDASTGAEVLRSVVESDGVIGLTLPAADSPRAFRLEVLSPLGTIEGALDVSVLRDATPPDLRFDPAPPQASALAALRLSGTVSDGETLTLDGAALPLVEGSFAADVALTDGLNLFQFLAEDRVGNVTLRQVSIVLDTVAPQVRSASAARAGDDSDAAGQIVVTVTASDAVGLRPVARFELAVAGQVETGFLRCDPAAGLCRATLPARPGALDLQAVEVSDYAGNTTRFLPPAGEED